MSNFYGATSLIGGGSGALDNIDGDNLSDGDGAVVITDGTAYFYHLNATSGESESSPDVISPDANAGTKRWILEDVYGGVDTFTELTDTPNSIASEDIGKVVKVSDSLNLEFVEEEVLDTEATAAELDELTDGSETTLHSHADPDKAFTDLTDVDEVSIESADIGKVVKVGDDLKLEFAEDISGGAGFGRPIILTPQSGMPPASNFATLDTITGGSTPNEAIPVLDFDASASEYMDFKFALPAGYAGGGLTVTIIFSMTSDHDEGTPHKVRWEVAFARISDDDLDMNGDQNYDFNGVSAIVPSAVGEVSYDNITFTNGADMDSLAAGEMAILRIYRDHDHGDDNATGDSQLQMILIKETP